VSSAFHIHRLCVIGVGLIGGSLARALRKAKCVDVIVGVGRDKAHLQHAKSLGVIDECETDIATAVRHADVVVVAVPLGAMQACFSALKYAVSDSTIITDVGSAKQSVLTAMQSAWGKLPPNFIPGHPIAGTEQSGVDASFAELFSQRRVILTPHAQSAAMAMTLVQQMWQHCGAQVTIMEAQHHDEVLAATSHLPHMLAYALVDTLARMNDRQEIFTYAAGGFRDFTRIASSDPQMWHDICLANREALAKMLRLFSTDLQRLCEAVERGDGEYLKTTFSRAKAARDQFGE
jgi:prephenate dehydrogenase